MHPDWHGVIPAITTPFNADFTIDHDFYAHHCRLLADAGCTGIVPHGSLGESATLAIDEKISLVRTAVRAVGARIPIIPGIAALSTAEAVRLARAEAEAGCNGLMVLPPYAYATDWREMKAHVSAVIRATDLPAMLYNNPPAYKTDFLPEHIAELAADHANFAAVKESSTDTRRIMAIRALVGDRLKILVGVDDGIVEAIQVGAVGWIAGLVNSFPEESVRLFALAEQVRDCQSDRVELERLYTWFLPLLRLDTVPKFVQLIKLSQEMVGLGNTRVRPPRLPLEGSELAAAQRIIQHALDQRPS
jgi:4-hydroxy-tetrahydrodipicolinate synthase